jgi:L-malate glycosyltransferase
VPENILFVESGRGYGGSAFSLFRLIKSLNRSRYRAHVVVFHSAQPFEQIRSLDVPVEKLRLFRPFFAPSAEDRTLLSKARNYCSVYGNLVADTLYNGVRLARYIKRKRIDLVHLNNGIFENLSAAFAARLAHVPCVSHVRGTGRLAKAEQYAAGWVSAVITLNSAVYKEYARAFARERLHLICNGVDLDALREPQPERIRREFGLEPQTFAVGTFARLMEGKGIGEFVATAGRVCKEHGDSRFFVVGDDATKGGTFETSLMRLAQEMRLGHRLVFTGWRDDRIDLMAAMDLVLQISTTFPEGMSLAPLEAMALGKPVIVTEIPGYEFSVDDGQTGFVVPPGDVQALTERVLTLALDRDLGKRMGREGYQKALRQFDVRLTARRVERVYDQVLHHRRDHAVPVSRTPWPEVHGGLAKVIDDLDSEARDR